MERTKLLNGHIQNAHTQDRQTNQVVCERNEKIKALTKRPSSENTGLDRVNNEKTSKFAESFCKPGLDIIFLISQFGRSGWLNAHFHLNSITKKHNNGMYFESFLRMNNKNMTYHVLSYTSYNYGAVEEVQL